MYENVQLMYKWLKFLYLFSHVTGIPFLFFLLVFQ